MKNTRIRNFLGFIAESFSAPASSYPLNECIAVTGKIGGSTFLFKNRDRSFTPNSTVIHEIYKGVEIAYYTDQTDWVEGMNQHGIGFIFSKLTDKHITGYGPSWSITDEPKSIKFKKFSDKVKNILTAKTVDEALALLDKSGKSGSFLIGNSENVYEVEIFHDKKEIRKLDFQRDSYYVKSNHGILIPQAGHPQVGDSIKRGVSEIRSHQAVIQLFGTKTIEEIPGKMKFQAYDPNSPLNTFRLDTEEITISQCLMDLTHLKFYYYHDPTTADSMEFKNDVKHPKIQVIAEESTGKNGTPSVAEKLPAVPSGYVKAQVRRNPGFFTPSLFKRPGDKKAKSIQRVMDYQNFLSRINYRTHDGIIQPGHGQNLR